jgi:AcrR family transcriptional regulator
MTAKRAKRGPGRPSGGSEQVVQAILRVTLKHLGERGFAALNVADVARDAGVNKTSVYRRWPSKGELVFAALGTMRQDKTPFVETGDIRSDLVTILKQKASMTSTAAGRKITLALIALEEEGEGAALVDALRKHRYALPEGVIQGAKDRGELGESVNPRLLSELMVAPIAYRTVLLGEKLERGYIERVVDHVLTAAKATGGAPSGIKKRSSSRTTPKRDR